MAVKFTNAEIARLFRQVAAVYTIQNVNRFRIIAYEKAADAIETSNLEIRDLWQDKRLSEIQGIGAVISGHLEQLFTSGKVREYEELFKAVPEGMLTLLDVSGFGPKKAYRLAVEFNLNDAGNAIDKLLKAARGDKIAPLEGFGAKSQADIIEALERFKLGQNKKKRMPLPVADATAKQLVAYLKKFEEAVQVEPLGSLRRKVSTIGDVDLAVATDKPQKVLEYFLKYPKKDKIIEIGPSGASLILGNGQHADLRVQKPRSFGAMLQYFTGSKQHNIHLREYALKKGLSLSEYGIKILKKSDKKQKLIEFPREEDFYKYLGLPWIPPELREDLGEIEAAINNRLPELVKLTDIKGEVHVHSNYNLEPSHDLGQNPLGEMVDKAQSLGYEYLGLSEHNPSVSKHTEKEVIAIMKRRKQDYEQIMLSKKNVRVKLFIMLEVDILPDGKLALPEKAFEFVDAVVVSVHTSFQMPKKEMTERVLAAFSHPKAKILAHPSGRLIGKREGYEIDWQRIFDFAKNHDKAIEINAHPSRLDLVDVLVKRAIENGNKLIIDTDSHDRESMDLMEYGISVARRGWAEKKDILNTMSYNKFKSWLIS
ncbi:MAG: polymerase subunit beta, DNA polymerase (family X) protein [Candidatus Gottesmanbacteria bacterium GW2011_GWA2_43_14]|uniref:Polymerase subunit beta, DNA polymerase (Family X) protein n=1 Tax=Candidatus Gottesmanbacteria bacterium GW2011_GWA2_43_14 TaxID=1618443 RepID=A0A0G1GIB6_9BACT|nr:MAG: polymerase subunit beta, DNA polymerase (family X) protein [Candidatus Gottesmanbacteria bacterium GW2011_GWA2_43_14]